MLSHSVKLLIVWGVLIAATLLYWPLGGGVGAEADHRLATIMIIAVASIKVRLVGLWFMELREAIFPLKLFLEAYAIAVGLIMIGFCLL